jgi:hypothetical protein
VAGQWFFPVSTTNKTDLHDITEILLKVALSTITHHPQKIKFPADLFIILIYNQRKIALAIHCYIINIVYVYTGNGQMT